MNENKIKRVRKKTKNNNSYIKLYINSEVKTQLKINSKKKKLTLNQYLINIINLFLTVN
jgi:hypothetical protein